MHRKIFLLEVLFQRSQKQKVEKIRSFVGLGFENAPELCFGNIRNTVKVE